MEKNKREPLTVEKLYEELHSVAPHDERWQEEVTRWENGLPPKTHGRRRLKTKGLFNVWWKKQNKD